MARGEVGSIEKLDDYTLKFSFPHPSSIFLLRLATSMGIWSMPNCPAHYLRPYHPRLGDPDRIDCETGPAFVQHFRPGPNQPPVQRASQGAGAVVRNMQHHQGRFAVKKCVAV